LEEHQRPFAVRRVDLPAADISNVDRAGTP